MDASGTAAQVGARVRALRERQGTSLSSLARQAHLSKATLSELEKGAGNPTLSTLAALAHALGVGVIDLLDHPDVHPRARH